MGQRTNTGRLVVAVGLGPVVADRAAVAAARCALEPGQVVGGREAFGGLPADHQVEAGIEIEHTVIVDEDTPSNHDVIDIQLTGSGQDRDVFDLPVPEDRITVEGDEQGIVAGVGLG